MSLSSMKMLVDALRHPQTMVALSASQWDLLIRQARCADLLARLYGLAQSRQCWDQLPLAPRRHLTAAGVLAARQHRELQGEVKELAQTLSREGGAFFVLLKGAAYVLSGRNAAQGRMVSDVDFLVSKGALARVESALLMAGWVSTNKNAYDQMYYRTWMHELPPLKHMTRGTVVDVHHAILPLSGRLKPSTALLLQDAIEVEGLPGVRVLSPVDMVLHSAAHLFHEGELELGLRGLVDLDALLVEFATIPGFWSDLPTRARVLDLQLPLYYALRYARKVLNTPVDARVMLALASALGRQAGGTKMRLMDAVYLRALRPDHPSLSDAWTPLARWALYVRAHWIRMPWWLLTAHLVRKTLNRPAKDT